MNTVSRTRVVVIAALIGVAFASSATAQPAGNAAGSLVVPMQLVGADGHKEAIGTIMVSDSRYGLMITPALSGLPPGLHGFHVHENPSCEPGEKDGKVTAALGAGGHLDPAVTGRHEGPYGNGHLGDLPAVYVSPEGKADQPLLAPRLKIADLAGRSLMIHAGGDNHADHPAPLGGGGPRIACGVIPASQAK